jgi:GT2 family glycosyltransferase
MLGAAAAATVCRSAWTVRKSRTVVPLRDEQPSWALPPSVTVVVPARNEAEVLHDCLAALRAQTYAEQDRAQLRVIVVDDGSTDATGAIAREHAEADARVTVERSAGPPAGWAGKVHAMYQGVEAAGEPAAGEWLLFVDADTVLAPDVLSRLLVTAEAADADLVSVPGAPPEHGRSAAWSLLVPPGLQLIGENAAPDGRGRRAFAIGHCLLVRRSHYEKIGGWAALASMRNEDVAIATAVRDHGGRTRVVNGLGGVTTSGMDPFRQGWASFRKSFVAGTGSSVPALAGIGVGQIALSVAAPAATFAGVRGGHRVVAAAGVAGWLAQAAAHRHTARLMHTDTKVAPLAPFTGSLFGFVMFDGAARLLLGKTQWKGRAC